MEQAIHHESLTTAESQLLRFSRSISKWIRQKAFPLTSGLLCFVWAFIGWLTVVPNQDILADGIQAQSFMRDPRLILAFPGQKHAGPLEYPFTVLAEWIAPGNYFVSESIRPILAFITGFLVAQLFLRLFPIAPRWAFLLSVAVGPAIIHGMLGPEGNPVGVWWLQPNWDMAWLLVTAGALIISKTNVDSPRTAVLGGVLIGLGFYAHPAIILLIVPLLTLVFLRTVPRMRRLLLGLVGAVIGVIPALISYVVNANVNKWDPSHGAFIAVDYYKSVGGALLGLTGIPDYMGALLPYAIGLAPSNYFLSGNLQSVIMWLFVTTVLIYSGYGIIQAVRARRAVSPACAVATAWVVAIMTMGVFITFVDPVWIYSSGLAILFWLSLGSLPSFFSRTLVGITVTSVCLAVVAISTITHNAKYLSSLTGQMQNKITVMDANLELADALQSQGAEVIFGSYYDAIQVGYAANWKMHTITNHYNRFPLTDDESGKESLIVAVNSNPTDIWGREALKTAQTACKYEGRYVLPTPQNYDKYICAPQALKF